MTNLSELLPSGGGAKEFSAVASGTLTSGQTVALKANGTVEAIANTALTEGVTAPTVIDSTNEVQYTTSVYDPLNNTIIIAYSGGTTAGYYIIGSFSGGNLTYTSPQTFDSGTSRIPRLSYDTDNNKVAIIYTNGNNQWRTKIGTPTATSITWGSAVAWNTHALTSSTGDVAYCPVVKKLVFLSRNSSNYPEIFYGTVSGTSVSYSTYDTYGNGYSGNLRLAFKPASGVGLMTGCVSSNNYGAYITITTTSTNYPQFVTQAYFRTQAIKNYGSPVVYDSGNDRYLISFTLNSGSNPIYVISTDAAGDFGSANTPQNLSSGNFESDLSYISSNSGGTTGNFLLTFAYTTGGTQRMTAQPVDLSASYYPTFPTSYEIQNGSDASSFITLTSVYDSNANRAVVVYNDYNMTPYTGKSSVYTPSGSETNASGFIGITSQAIANTATGKVNPQGGVATASSPSSGEAGTAVVFTGNIASNDTVAVFDSSSNQVVIGFQNASTGGGQAIVADLTASTNAVTLGSAGSYQSAGGASYNAITYDASANKIVSICSALASPFQGVAYVGTVSGTSISYTGAVNFNGTENYQGGDLTYDSSNNVTVVSFERNDSGSNKHGASVVGTISGGAITFGTASDFAPSTNIQYANNTFDSNSNKVVTVFQNSSTGYGNAVVGTVSGTTISHGSLGVLTTNGVEMGTGGTICFDSTNNKVIAPYRNTTDSKGYVRIGTVSGTTITFGSAVEFDSAPGGQSIRSVYDSNLNKVIIFYTDSSNYPTVRTGTVSGTSIVLDDAFTVATTTVTTDMSCAAAFDSSENRTLLSYKPSATGLGNAQVYLTAGTPQDLIVGSTYYVQNNGNLSTTSSSVTAGKAISTTQLILNGAS